MFDDADAHTTARGEDAYLGKYIDQMYLIVGKTGGSHPHYVGTAKSPRHVPIR